LDVILRIAKELYLGTVTANRKEEDSKEPRSFGGLWAPPISRSKLTQILKRPALARLLVFFVLATWLVV
jgi:hypothetical protein